MAQHYQGDDLLEQGVMAEFDGKSNPDLFKTALRRFEETSKSMAHLDDLMGELIAIDQKEQLVTEFDMPLRKILKESPPPERVGLEGKRYANVAQRTKSGPPPRALDLAAVMKTQRDDLRTLRRQMDETIEAFRSVLPYAEKGEFAAMMLSGRHGFADKIQQSVDLMGIYGRYYTSTCMATIAATMQAYPAGLEWLKDGERGKDGT